MQSATDLSDMSVPAATQAQRLAEALSCTVHPEARGGASRTLRLAATDHLVTVPLTWPDDARSASDLLRRATLQERIAGRVSVSEPRVVRTVPEAGLVVVRRLPGERLLDAGPARQRAVRDEVASTLGSLLAQLHTWEREAYEDVAVADAYTPEDWGVMSAGDGLALLPGIRPQPPAPRREERLAAIEEREDPTSIAATVAHDQPSGLVPPWLDVTAEESWTGARRG
jgi:hypothetical protein